MHLLNNATCKQPFQLITMVKSARKQVNDNGHQAETDQGGVAFSVQHRWHRNMIKWLYFFTTVVII